MSVVERRAQAPRPSRLHSGRTVRRMQDFSRLDDSIARGVGGAKAGRERYGQGV
eukprot:SAG31_NODE_42686_length_267_cov_0.900585_1_plen_53_part_10